MLTPNNQEILNKIKRRVVTIEHGQIASDRANARYNVQ
jgi:ABC-type ATPase involved in cell division